MNMIELIAKKRDKIELKEQEIDWFAQGAANGTIPDYQLSAFLMAVRLNGMTPQETAALTLSMMRSGDVADLSRVDGPVCDKHSTGGVGDSVTFVALPIAAACGVKIAKMSGRALGHTGGTIDKLESIGVDTNLTIPRMAELAQDVGLVIAQQSGQLAPADKALYALRDVTATVDSIPLIASSILSKKFATGADLIVLDVKAGSGALMGGAADALRLAGAMRDIALLAGRRAVCVVTDMSQPLGRYVGNRIEVYEAVMTLKNQMGGRLLAVALVIAALLIKESRGVTYERAREMASLALLHGDALKKLREMVAAQGGDTGAVDQPETLLRASMAAVPAQAGGYVRSIMTDEVGRAAQELGAGRLTKADEIDPDVGVVMRVSLGDKIEEGQPLAVLYHKDGGKAGQAALRIGRAVEIGPERPDVPPLIYNILE